jgi:hypothetical protein
MGFMAERTVTSRARPRERESAPILSVLHSGLWVRRDVDVITG